jgi:hypothetical protein
MNWIGLDFVNHTINFLKMVQEHEISENSFSQGKRVGLGLSSIVMIYKNVFHGNHELYLVLLGKLEFFEKRKNDTNFVKPWD